MAETNQEFLSRQFGVTAPSANSEMLNSLFGAPTPVAPTIRQAKDIGDAIYAGAQSAAMGLLLRGKLPEVQLAEDAPWYHRTAAGAAGVVADLIPSVLGAAGGMALGTPGGPAGMAVGGGAGAFAVPMAMREALVTAYNANLAASWQGVWEITKASMKGFAKGAVIGGLTGGAGRVVTPMVAPAVAGMSTTGARVATGTAVFGAELSTMTTATAALEGHMPTWRDFMDNAILLGGMKGAVAIAKGMRNTYAETGRLPEQILADAARNPQVKADLTAGKVPEAYAPLALEQRIQAALDKDNKPELTKAVLAAAKGETVETKGDLVRYEYLTDVDSIKGVIRAVAETNKEQVEAQRRNTVPIRDSIIDAKALLADGELARHTRGEADAPHEAAARAMLVRDSATRAKRLALELDDTPIANRSTMQKLEAQAAVEQVALFYGELAGGVAEAARTLRMMRELKRNPELLGEAELMLKLYNKSGKDIGEYAGLMRDMTPDGIARLSNDLSKATTLEKVLEVFRANIFSGLRTHEANFLGNLTRWFVEVPESMLKATTYAGQRALEGDPLKMAQFKARAFAPLIGMYLGVKDGVIAAANLFRLNQTHLEKVEVFRLANEGVVGAYTGTVFRALQAGDLLFRVPGERAEAYILAVDRVVKEGLHPETQEGRAQIMQYTNNPTYGLTEKAAQNITAQIYRKGAEAAYSERLGPRMEKIQQAIAGSWGQFIVPAFRTPVNLVSWVVQHMPGLNFMSARWRADYAAGGERQAQAIARVAIGAGLAGVAYTMFENETLTDGGLFDPEMRKTKEGAGIQEYSVKIGNEYYNIERIEPIAKIFMLTADLMALWKAAKDKGDKAKIAYMSILAFSNATISTTYMSGMANTIRAVTEPARAADTFVENYASALVPKALGQLVETADPYKREVDGALEAIASQLPWMREKLLPQRDVWGDKLKNEKLFSVMPLSMTREHQDKVKSEAVRLHFAIVDAPKFMELRGPFNAKDKRVDFSAEQRDILREVRGAAAMRMLSPLVNSPDWKGLPDFVQAHIYKDALTRAGKEGQYEALSPEDAAVLRVQEQILNKVFKQIDEAESR